MAPSPATTLPRQGGFDTSVSRGESGSASGREGGSKDLLGARTTSPPIGMRAMSPAPTDAPLIIGENEDESFSVQPSTNASPFLAPRAAADPMSVPPLSFSQHVGGSNCESTEGSPHTMHRSGLGDVLVISGGSGFNALVGATPGATHVMPISDDGGSSSEIIRVLGGPSIGDVRSRLVRLIPTSSTHDHSSPPPPPSNDALHALLSYRLPTQGRSRDIKQEWMDILEGRHHLWRGIEPERKECIRGFLVHFESEILRRVQRNFDFRGGSIGNFFLAAAQKFFRSIQSAIFLFSATALVHASAGGLGGKVLPAINTNHTATIAAVLENGKVVVGQCEISHPSSPPDKRMPGQTETPGGSEHQSREVRRGLLSQMQSSGIQTPASGIFDPLPSVSARGVASRLLVGHIGDGLDPGSGSDSDNEDGNCSDGNVGAACTARQSNIVFSKEATEASPLSTGPRTSKSGIPSLDARIARLLYVNAYGQEVDPAPNPAFLDGLKRCKTLLYSCGSLWTSIVPCIALRGVARAVSTSPSLEFKILLLNTTPDRETMGLAASDFLQVIQRSMQHSDGLGALPIRDIITHVIYHPYGMIPIDVTHIESLGIRCIAVDLPSGAKYFDEESVRKALNVIVASEHGREAQRAS